MSWDAVILPQAGNGNSLTSVVEHLFSCQRRDWTLFRQGESALSTIRKKILTLDGSEIVVQSNPGRRNSTHAKTDAKSIAARKCFLCPENFPEEERGIAFEGLVILPNPYPILSRHCTIPSRKHQPQRIKGQVGVMLELARSLGPSMAVFYNGPQCGASAPDHFHFQACRAKGIPLIEQLSTVESSETPMAHESFGRRLLVLASRDVVQIERQIENAIDALGELRNEDSEPMINLIVHARDNGYQALFFPREAHRPTCYFASGAEQLAVSPAALEMAGIVVVAEPDHFKSVDAEAIHQIYSEVSLDSSQFCQLVDAIR